ncbi:hypothetical protein GWK26_08525 [haloarchaeon 3A1-DGR]|nr:hypothetical protein GWK26_08525 [haloarchaeon 3A1-DGR]
MTESDHTLTLRATGRARFDTAVESDAMDVTRSRTEEILAELELDADRLYNGDVATTHKAGVTIPASDVADVVCDELGAKPVDPSEWDIAVVGTIDDWKEVVVGAAKKRVTPQSHRLETAIDALLSLHERFAERDLPIYAALHLDEMHSAGRRDELLERLGDDADAESTATTEVAA